MLSSTIKLSSAPGVGDVWAEHSPKYSIKECVQYKSVVNEFGTQNYHFSLKLCEEDE